jgi:DNA-binding winged helix-turn-helix (wHTH) protein
MYIIKRKGLRDCSLDEVITNWSYSGNIGGIRTLPGRWDSRAIVKEFPPFGLDTANQCLWRHVEAGNDERILLTPKAFAVLRHLVERAGRLVTQDELLDAVWPDAHVEPAVLKNQILSIRNALGDRPKSPIFIETLPRRGYRIIATVREGGPTRTSEVTRYPENWLAGRRHSVSCGIHFGRS